MLSRPCLDLLLGLGAPVSSRKVLMLQGPKVSHGLDTRRKVLLLGEAVDHAFPVNFLVQMLCVGATTSIRPKMSLISQKEVSVASLKGTSLPTSYVLEAKCQEGKCRPGCPGIQGVSLPIPSFLFHPKTHHPPL